MKHRWARSIDLAFGAEKSDHTRPKHSSSRTSKENTSGRVGLQGQVDAIRIDIRNLGAETCILHAKDWLDYTCQMQTVRATLISGLRDVQRHSKVLGTRAGLVTIQVLYLIHACWNWQSHKSRVANRPSNSDSRFIDFLSFLACVQCTKPQYLRLINIRQDSLVQVSPKSNMYCIVNHSYGSSSDISLVSNERVSVSSSRGHDETFGGSFNRTKTQPSAPLQRWQPAPLVRSC